jgi:hypothetical protein
MAPVSKILVTAVLAALTAIVAPARAQAPAKKPNILIIWGDDIGWYNLSAYNMGVFLLVPAQAYVASWLQSFREFQPRQKPASFSLDRVMESITAFPRAN